MIRTNWRKPVRSTCCIGLVALLAGCSVGPAYKNPIFPFATSYAAPLGGSPVLLDNAAWWQGFKDPNLNELIKKALSGNLDLALATERVTEAQALTRTIPQGGSITGNVDAGVSGSRGTSSRTGAEGSFGVSWLFDPYGGRDAQNRAAAARVEVADAELGAAQLLLSGVTTAYIELRFHQRALQLRRQELGHAAHLWICYAS